MSAAAIDERSQRKRECSREYYQRNREKMVRRARLLREKNREKYLAQKRSRVFTPEQRAGRRAAVVGWKQRNPEKRRAHEIVFLAIRNGSLIRGTCETCGAEKVDAHHDDYSKPLEVRWFCRRHHFEHHRINAE